MAIEKLCFSTLGCAELSMREIAEIAHKNNLWGVEVRGKSADAHMSPDTPWWAVQEIKNIYEALNVRIASVTSYVKMADTENFAAGLEEVKRYAALCNELNAPYVRVYYGDGFSSTEEEIAANIARLCEAVADTKVQVLIEMHDALKTSDQALRLIQKAGTPENFGVIFNTFQPFKEKEDAVESWKKLAPYVGSLHLNLHSKPDENGKEHQALPVDNAYPTDALFEAIKKDPFQGPSIIMWERFFDKTLAPLQDAIDGYKKFLY